MGGPLSSGGGCGRPEAGERSGQVCHLYLGSQKAEPGAKFMGHFLLGVRGPRSTSDGVQGKPSQGGSCGLATAQSDACLNWRERGSKKLSHLRIRTVCWAGGRAEHFIHQLPPPRAQSFAPGDVNCSAFQIVPIWALSGVPSVSSEGEPSAGGCGDRGRLFHLPQSRGQPRTLPEVPEQWRKRGLGPGGHVGMGVTALPVYVSQPPWCRGERSRPQTKPRLLHADPLALNDIGLCLSLPICNTLPFMGPCED